MFKEILTIDDCSRIGLMVEQSDRIVVIGHQNPDGDAVGAVLGVSAWLRSMGKNPMMVVPDAFPDFLQWLPMSDNIARYDKRKNEIDLCIEIADLLICVDFNEYSRVADMEPVLRSYKGKVIHIDHHIDPAIRADIVVSDNTASSTCELVFKIVWQLGDYPRLDKSFHVPIFTGMMTDTGTFEYANAGPDTFIIVGELLKAGVDKAQIHRNVYDTYSHWRLKLTGYVLYQKLRVLKKYHASYFILTKEELSRFHFIKGDAEGLVNLPLQMKGHKLSISLREDTVRPNTVWVSARSVGNIPCNKICARFFNGGGHLNASGGRLECSIIEAEDIVNKAIESLPEYENEKNSEI